jgi:CheY-like chemotaxis protein
MRRHKCRALILDSDPDALLTLQRTLENGGVDTTITWDSCEARSLVRTTSFDVVLIGEHPPEIDVENTVRDLRVHGSLSPCLILRTTGTGNARGDWLRQLGVSGVLPKRDPAKALEEVHKAVRQERTAS